MAYYKPLFPNLRRKNKVEITRNVETEFEVVIQMYHLSSGEKGGFWNFEIFRSHSEADCLELVSLIEAAQGNMVEQHRIAKEKLKQNYALVGNVQRFSKLTKLTETKRENLRDISVPTV